MAIELPLNFTLHYLLLFVSWFSNQNCVLQVVIANLKIHPDFKNFYVVVTTYYLYLRMKYVVQECIGARLRKLSRVVDSFYKKKLFDFEITESQVTILFILNKTKKIEQGKIGQLLFLERSTISRNIKLLEKRKLLTKTLEYRPMIELTEKGKILVENILPIWNEIMNELMNKIGKKGFKIIKELENKFE